MYPLLAIAGIALLITAAHLRAKARPDRPLSTENIAILLGVLALPAGAFAQAVAA